MYMLYEFDTPVRKIPMRERHFRTATVVLGAMILSHIPLLNSLYEVETSPGALTFFIRGTMMHLGTQPFALANMGLMIAGQDEKQSNLYGIGMTVVMALMQQQHWTCTLQLVGISILLANAMNYLDVYGSISLSTALIFLNASERFVKEFMTYPTLVVVAIIIAVVWIDQLAVTIPLTHTRRRSQNISMRLPVMYNSTTALILYSTCAEICFPNQIIASVALVPAVYIINLQLPDIQKTTAKDLVREWAGENYTIRGWHSKQRMVKYVQGLIDRNIWWNTVLLCGLWAISTACRTSITASTIFLLTSTAKQYVNQPMISLRG